MSHLGIWPSFKCPRAQRTNIPSIPFVVKYRPPRKLSTVIASEHLSFCSEELDERLQRLIFLYKISTWALEFGNRQKIQQPRKI